MPFSTTTTSFCTDIPEAEKLPQFLDFNEAACHQKYGKHFVLTALHNKNLMYAQRGKAWGIALEKKSEVYSNKPHFQARLLHVEYHIC